METEQRLHVTPPPLTASVLIVHSCRVGVREEEEEEEDMGGDVEGRR
jgi:hypothetical protein